MYTLGTLGLPSFGHHGEESVTCKAIGTHTHTHTHTRVGKQVARDHSLEEMVVSARSKECSACLSPDCAVQEIAT